MSQNLLITHYGQLAKHAPTLVLLHGWGLNSGVWQPLIDKLSNDFSIVTVDLPGFGINHQNMPELYSLSAIANWVVSAVEEEVKQPAIYLGWSLGGLVATEIAVNHFQSCQALITVASNPCFKANETWPGIKAEYLSVFYRTLEQNIEKTLNNFLKLQAMGSPHIRQDIKQMQALVMAHPLPKPKALKGGLDLLNDCDLRHYLAAVKQPFLRMYGKLDSLVPPKTQVLVDELSPKSQSYQFEQASHAPFVSHLNEFEQTLRNWLASQVV